MSPKELREFAEECREWAKSARSDQERRIFLQMARTWLEVAAWSEGRLDGHPAFEAPQRRRPEQSNQANI